MFSVFLSLTCRCILGSRGGGGVRKQMKICCSYKKGQKPHLPPPTHSVRLRGSGASAQPARHAQTSSPKLAWPRPPAARCSSGKASRQRLLQRAVRAVEAAAVRRRDKFSCGDPGPARPLPASSESFVPVHSVALRRPATQAQGGGAGPAAPCAGCRRTAPAFAPAPPTCRTAERWLRSGIFRRLQATFA